MPLIRKPLMLPYIGLSLSASVLAPLIYVYLSIIEVVPEPLQPKFEFKYVFLVPVPMDEGTIVLMSLILTVFSAPLYLYARKSYAWMRSLQSQIREFFTVFSSIAESTESTVEALRYAAKLVDPPLSVLVEKFANMYSVEGSIDDAYRKVFRETPREIRLLMASIVAASRSGGARARILAEASRYAHQLYRFRVAVETRLAEYVAIVLLASITFAVAAAVVTGLVETMAASALPRIGGAAIDTKMMRGLFYYSAIMLAAASSVVLGKVVRGYTLLATKYFTLLIPLVTAILLLVPMLMPAS